LFAGETPVRGEIEVPGGAVWNYTKNYVEVEKISPEILLMILGLDGEVV
jgi:hypothetical protein